MPEEGHSAVSGCRYVRQRETVMIAERLGCQACILFCGLQAASVQHSAEVAQSWPGVILAEVVASALQLLHLPIGFQVGFWPNCSRGALTEALLVCANILRSDLLCKSCAQQALVRCPAKRRVLRHVSRGTQCVSV